MPPDAEPIRQAYGSYTVERAANEGYVRDEFCLDAASFGQPTGRGAMGYHATDERLLRGPIDANRPQAMMFDGQGKVLGSAWSTRSSRMRCRSRRAFSERVSASCPLMPASSTSITLCISGLWITRVGH